MPLVSTERSCPMSGNSFVELSQADSSSNSKRSSEPNTDTESDVTDSDTSDKVRLTTRGTEEPTLLGFATKSEASTFVAQSSPNPLCETDKSMMNEKEAEEDSGEDELIEPRSPTEKPHYMKRRGPHKGVICAIEDCKKFARLTDKGLRKYCISHMRKFGMTPKAYSNINACNNSVINNANVTTNAAGHLPTPRRNDYGIAQSLSEQRRQIDPVLLMPSATAAEASGRARVPLFADRLKGGIGVAATDRWPTHLSGCGSLSFAAPRRGQLPQPAQHLGAAQMAAHTHPWASKNLSVDVGVGVGKQASLPAAIGNVHDPAGSLKHPLTTGGEFDAAFKRRCLDAAVGIVPKSTGAGAGAGQHVDVGGNLNQLQRTGVSMFSALFEMSGGQGAHPSVFATPATGQGVRGGAGSKPSPQHVPDILPLPHCPPSQQMYSDMASFLTQRSSLGSTGQGLLPSVFARQPAGPCQPFTTRNSTSASSQFSDKSTRASMNTAALDHSALPSPDGSYCHRGLPDAAFDQPVAIQVLEVTPAALASVLETINNANFPGNRTPTIIIQPATKLPPPPPPGSFRLLLQSHTGELVPLHAKPTSSLSAAGSPHPPVAAGNAAADADVVAALLYGLQQGHGTMDAGVSATMNLSRNADLVGQHMDSRLIGHRASPQQKEQFHPSLQWTPARAKAAMSTPDMRLENGTGAWALGSTAKAIGLQVPPSMSEFSIQGQTQTQITEALILEKLGLLPLRKPREEECCFDSNLGAGSALLSPLLSLSPSPQRISKAVAAQEVAAAVDPFAISQKASADREREDEDWTKFQALFSGLEGLNSVDCNSLVQQLQQQLNAGACHPGSNRATGETLPLLSNVQVGANAGAIQKGGRQSPPVSSAVPKVGSGGKPNPNTRMGFIAPSGTGPRTTAASPRSPPRRVRVASPTVRNASSTGTNDSPVSSTGACGVHESLHDERLATPAAAALGKRSVTDRLATDIDLQNTSPASKARSCGGAARTSDSCGSCSENAEKKEAEEEDQEHHASSTPLVAYSSGSGRVEAHGKKRTLSFGGDLRSGAKSFIRATTTAFHNADREERRVEQGGVFTLQATPAKVHVVGAEKGGKIDMPSGGDLEGNHSAFVDMCGRLAFATPQSTLAVGGGASAAAQLDLARVAGGGGGDISTWRSAASCSGEGVSALSAEMLLVLRRSLGALSPLQAPTGFLGHAHADNLRVQRSDGPPQVRSGNKNPTTSDKADELRVK